MTVRRIMGIETEYGVLEPGNSFANPMLMSSQVVLGYKSALGAAARPARWDYLHEDPLSDARGFHVLRAAAHPSLLTDDPSRPAPSGDEVTPAGMLGGPATPVARGARRDYEDPGAANAVLPNGARLYVDHAHPEYSSPEVTNPRDGVLWDVAGEHVMRAAMAEASAMAGRPILLYKNNADGKGASYGTHENYLVARAVPFETLVSVLTPFFVTRQIFTGSGRVGIGQRGQEAGFQISQRADYIEAEVGLETTMRRPIINTRDEPHADRDAWRRLHVIVGDANLFQVATYLKLGTTSLMLWLAERTLEHPELLGEVEALSLRDPVAAVAAVSRDTELAGRIELASGQWLSALQIQRRYLALVTRELATAGGVPDPDTADVLARWDGVLNDLYSDRAAATGTVEWLAKLALLERLRSRDGLEWSHPKLAAFDIQWSDITAGTSIVSKLARAGAVEAIVSDEQGRWAVDHPPEDTRAYFRGSVISRFPDAISGASWDSVVFDIPGAATLQRLAMPDPHRGTKELVGDLIAGSGSAAELLAALST